jgi:hypothetical protein
MLLSSPTGVQKGYVLQALPLVLHLYNVKVLTREGMTMTMKRVAEMINLIQAKW